MSFTRKTLLPAALAVGLLFAATAVTAAQTRLDKAVYFTFSKAISLPAVTLPAGRYLFRLADSQVQRNIIMVYSGDGSKYYGTFMTIPDQYATFGGKPPNDPQIRFMEAAAGSPTPVRSYYYPGERVGYEFVYPREQAMRLAKAAKEPVLTTAEDVSGDKMQSADLSRVNASGQDAPVNGQAPAATATAANDNGQVQSGEVVSNMPTLAPAPNARSRTAAADTTQSTAVAANQSASAAPVRTRLPQTASATPLLALIGMLSLAVGLELARRRRLS